VPSPAPPAEGSSGAACESTCPDSDDGRSGALRPAARTARLARRRLSRGSLLRQTRQPQPMTGIPWEVPVPRKVIFRPVKAPSAPRSAFQSPKNRRPRGRRRARGPSSFRDSARGRTPPPLETLWPQPGSAAPDGGPSECPRPFPLRVDRARHLDVGEYHLAGELRPAAVVEPRLRKGEGHRFLRLHGG